MPTVGEMLMHVVACQLYQNGYNHAHKTRTLPG
jgi:hypothetical protein